MKQRSYNVSWKRKISHALMGIVRKKGKEHYRWNGGIFIDFHGYRKIQQKNGKYLLEHRVIMEKFLGRKLKKHEIVHHKDGNKLNNKIENLEIMTRIEHVRHHKPRLGK